MKLFSLLKNNKNNKNIADKKHDLKSIVEMKTEGGKESKNNKKITKTIRKLMR